jgi:septal ring factor EnvC (AmiA/AmiB activator)
MLKSRSCLDLRTLALVSAAACVLCAPLVAAAASTTAATSATKSATAKKSHGKAAASEERADVNEHLQTMTERLSLTDDQVTKVREILQSNAKQMSALHAKYNGMLETPENKSTMAKAKEEVHASTQAKLAHVLSAGQMAEYRKMGTEHTKHSSESATKAASASATQR